MAKAGRPKGSTKKTGEKNTKKRNWAFMVYPESAPDDWFDRLQKTGLQCAISPLHDKDVDQDGEGEKPKKSHYHVIITYSGPTSFNVVKGITDSLNAPIPQALEQVKGYFRYLTHKDNPEKYQYDAKEIRTINGFNIFDYTAMTRSEVNAVIRDLLGLIRREDMTEYSELLDFLLDGEKYDQLDIARSHTLLFSCYLTSRRYIQEKPAKGEVIAKKQ